jgi:polyphosphate kinase
VFYFESGGAEDVYLASADWMARNFFRRIELCFAVLDPGLKKRVVREGLLPYLEDNMQAWAMASDGSYERLRSRKGSKGRSAQDELLVALAGVPPAPKTRAPAPPAAVSPTPGEAEVRASGS